MKKSSTSTSNRGKAHESSIKGQEQSAKVSLDSLLSEARELVQEIRSLKEITTVGFNSPQEQALKEQAPNETHLSLVVLAKIHVGIEECLVCQEMSGEEIRVVQFDHVDGGKPYVSRRFEKGSRYNDLNYMIIHPREVMEGVLCTEEVPCLILNY